MTKDRAINYIKWQVAFLCGYAWAASFWSGNWWNMLLWLIIPIGAIAEGVVEKSRLFK